MEKTKRYVFAFLWSSFLFPVNGYCSMSVGNRPAVIETVIDVIGILGFVALGIYIMADPKVLRNRFFRVLAIGALLIVTSCATVEKSTLFGAGVGASSGAGVGVLVERSAGSMAIGAAVGGALGGALAYLLHDRSEKEAHSKAVNGGIPIGELPALRPAEAACIRTGERIEEGRYLGPRLECTIQKPAVWTR